MYNKDINMYELWEIMKDGKDGEIFEVTHCNLPDYIGQKIMVDEEETFKGKFKTLVDPNNNRQSPDALITLFGCLGTATYKKVEQHEKVTFLEAMKSLKDLEEVYVQDGYVRKKLTFWTPFSTLTVGDMEDLMNMSFYVKAY